MTDVPVVRICIEQESLLLARLLPTSAFFFRSLL